MASPTCPECGGQMFFAPDGRTRQCERCGHKATIQKERPSAQSIADALRLLPERDGYAGDSAGVRVQLAQGVAAAKAGETDEAFFVLEAILRTNSTEKQRATAWFWLSRLYDDAADKRVCLEQALFNEPTNPLARREMAVLDGRLRPDEIIDPEKIRQEAAAPDQPRTVHAEHMRCPRCAARMNYTPDNQALVCDYCGYRQELILPGVGVRPQFGFGGGIEKDFIAALAAAKGHLQPVATRSLNCQTCGIELVLAPETLSVTCPYCASVYVAEAAETRQILPPQALIPFAVNEDEAKQALRHWFRKRKIERPRITPLIGIYLPLWTFDIGGEVSWQGQVRRGDSWVPASGSKYFFYDDVLVWATERLQTLLAKTADAFDFSGLVVYDARYLADWPAERYQLALADASLQARKRLVKGLRRSPDELTSARYVRDLRINSGNLMIESYKLVLVPVWTVHFKVEGSMYDVVINGQTAVVRGQRPQSAAGKLFSWLKGE